MPEVLPNWHPAIVHFPIALTITATLLLLVTRLRPADPLLLPAARLLLRLAAGGAVVAAVFGGMAFAQVEHDAAGHLVMLSHRNWALASTAGLVLAALLDGLGKFGQRSLTLALLALSVSVGITAWQGGEMVYRHGVGVSATALAAEPEPQAATNEPLATPPAASPLLPGDHIHADGRRHHH